MSFPDAPQLSFTRSASRAIVAIFRYTSQTWGGKQAVVYQDKLDRAFLAIAANPHAGHCREDLPPAFRARVVGSHIVIYRIDDHGVTISRILHQRMDARRRV